MGLRFAFLGVVVAVLQLVHSVHGIGVSPVQVASDISGSLPGFEFPGAPSRPTFDVGSMDQSLDDLQQGLDDFIEKNSDVTNPSAPTGLRVTAQDGCAVTLEWDAAFDEVEVEFYTVSQDGQFAGRIEAPTTMIRLRMFPDSASTFTVSARDSSFNESEPSRGVEASC